MRKRLEINFSYSKGSNASVVMRLYCIILYLFIYIALLAAHTNDEMIIIIEM